MFNYRKDILFALKTLGFFNYKKVKETMESKPDQYFTCKANSEKDFLKLMDKAIKESSLILENN